VEEVDTGIDPVSYEFDWFLDESVNDGRVWLCDHHTIVGWFGNFGHLGVSVVLPSTCEACVPTMMDPSHPWAMWKSLASISTTPIPIKKGPTGNPRKDRYK